MLAGIFPHHAFKAVFWESYLSKPSPINLTLFQNSEVVGVCLGKPRIKNKTKPNPVCELKKKQNNPHILLVDIYSCDFNGQFEAAGIPGTESPGGIVCPGLACGPDGEDGLHCCNCCGNTQHHLSLGRRTRTV